MSARVVRPRFKLPTRSEERNLLASCCGTEAGIMEAVPAQLMWKTEWLLGSDDARSDRGAAMPPPPFTSCTESVAFSTQASVVDVKLTS